MFPPECAPSRRNFIKSAGMSQNDLDFLLDDKANRIGALLMHLAATDRIYQINLETVSCSECA
jgi:hypothetical protein